MTNTIKPHIFVVDDDSCICDTIYLFLKKAGFECTCFTDPNDCLSRLCDRSCDLIITDVRMPDTDGITLLKEAKRIVPWLPVLMMSSYGDIAIAVKAVKAGALDFIEKPIEWEKFLALVESAVKQNELADLLKTKPLTRTETIVLHMILQGRTNRQISEILHRSVRTVEVHRSHIMNKLNVSNVIQLAQKAIAMALDKTR